MGQATCSSGVDSLDAAAEAASCSLARARAPKAGLLALEAPPGLREEEDGRGGPGLGEAEDGRGLNGGVTFGASTGSGAAGLELGAGLGALTLAVVTSGATTAGGNVRGGTAGGAIDGGILDGGGAVGERIGGVGGLAFPIGQAGAAGAAAFVGGTAVVGVVARGLTRALAPP